MWSNQLVTGTGLPIILTWIGPFFNFCEGVRAKAKDGFRFYVQKQPVPKSGSTSLAEKPQLDTKPNGWQVGRKSTVGAL